MSTLFNGGELRYIVISAFGLILLSTITYSMGMAIDPYQPPEVNEQEQLEDEQWWETGEEDDSWWTLGSDTLEAIMGLIGAIFSFIGDIFVMLNGLIHAWGVLLSVSGWASVFFIVPMFVMFSVLLSAVLSIIGVLPTT